MAIRLRKQLIAIIVGVVAFLALAFALTPRLLPHVLSRIQPRILFRGDAARKVIYLTIDDAPTTATPEILAVLAKHRVPATFFIIAGRVQSERELDAIVAAGHSLGHHMRTTKACAQLDWPEFKSDFDATSDLIRKHSPARFFRPPSDFGTVAQLEYVSQQGYQPVLGTVFAFDHWLERKSLLKALDRWLMIPGGIVIMHDGNDRGRRTAAVLDELIPEWKADGYKFEPLDHLAAAPSSR